MSITTQRVVNGLPTAINKILGRSNEQPLTPGDLIALRDKFNRLETSKESLNSKKIFL